MQRAVPLQRFTGVSDVEIVLQFRVHPDIGFDTGAAGGEGVEKGDGAQVVVVRVAGDGVDVAAVGGPGG